MPSNLLPDYLLLKIMLNLQQILNHISVASTAELHQILSAVQNELPKREGHSCNYVEHIEDFCADTELLDFLWAECESMDLGSKKKVATQWLSSNKDPYIYPDSTPVHKAKNIKEFPNINKLLSLVNESSEVTGPLDSCLILKYNSHQSSLTLHADDEPTIDQNKSICSFSIGCDRTIEFYEKSSKPKLVKKARMTNNSLVVMRPGTQQHLKHCVRAEPRSSSSVGSQVRYALSFRAVKKILAPTGLREEQNLSPVQVTDQGPVLVSPQPRKRVCLIAGDSYAARMDVEKLAKGKVVVENIAEGGSKMDKVQKQLEDYKASNPGKDVTKIIVSVGTNDIRNCINGVNHLRGPLKNLCTKITDLYPGSAVYFQALLPLPLKDLQDTRTNRTVLDFNRLIYNECKYRHFYLIEAFFPFCKFSRRRNEPHSRFDKLFERGGIHPNPEKGMGVLARMYIRALHSKYFNPCVFQ